jgi:malic enzyme
MPHALVQWEDFRRTTRSRSSTVSSMLAAFVQRRHQGTGAVVVAGINSALKIKNERLAAQRIVISARAAGLAWRGRSRRSSRRRGVPAERQLRRLWPCSIAAGS